MYHLTYKEKGEIKNCTLTAEQWWRLIEKFNFVSMKWDGLHGCSIIFKDDTRTIRGYFIQTKDNEIHPSASESGLSPFV